MSGAPAFLEKLDSLVETIMSEAAKPDVKLSDRLEALKICSQHYVNTQRLKGKGEQPPSGETTMGSLKDQIDSAARNTGDEDDEAHAS